MHILKVEHVFEKKPIKGHQRRDLKLPGYGFGSATGQRKNKTTKHGLMPATKLAFGLLGWETAGLNSVCTNGSVDCAHVGGSVGQSSPHKRTDYAELGSKKEKKLIKKTYRIRKFYT